MKLTAVVLLLGELRILLLRFNKAISRGLPSALAVGSTVKLNPAQCARLV